MNHGEFVDFERKTDMKKIFWMSLCVLFAAGTVQAALDILDIEGIYIDSCKDYTDGTPDTNPWEFEIWVDIANKDSLHHIDITLPGGTTKTIYEDSGDWEYESSTDYSTLADLRADYPTGDYVFSFEKSDDTVLCTVTLNYADLSEPANPVDFTYPAYNGQTGISTNPTFEWTVGSSDANALGMWVWDTVEDKDLYEEVPVSMDTTSWSPGLMDPNHTYELEVSVINIKDGLPGPALPTMTVDSDEFEYGLLIEYCNCIEFATVPEPATIALLCIGTMSLLRKRRA